MTSPRDDRRKYERWGQRSRHLDQVFGSENRQQRYEQALGAPFISLDELDDKLFAFDRVDIRAKPGGMRRYIPPLEDTRACEVYPKCPISGWCLPFVYNHSDLRCSKNGEDPTLFTSDERDRLLSRNRVAMSCYACSTSGDTCDLSVGVMLYGKKKCKFGLLSQYKSVQEALAAGEARSAASTRAMDGNADRKPDVSHAGSNSSSAVAPARSGVTQLPKQKMTTRAPTNDTTVAVPTGHVVAREIPNPISARPLSANSPTTTPFASTSTARASSPGRATAAALASEIGRTLIGRTPMRQSGVQDERGTRPRANDVGGHQNRNLEETVARTERYKRMLANEKEELQALEELKETRAKRMRLAEELS